MDGINEKLRKFLISNFKSYDNFYNVVKLCKDFIERDQLIQKVEDLSIDDKSDVRYNFLSKIYELCIRTTPHDLVLYYKYSFRHFLYFWQHDQKEAIFYLNLPRNVTILNEEMMSAYAFYILIFVSQQDSLSFLQLNQNFSKQTLESISKLVKNFDYISLKNMMGSLWYFPAIKNSCDKMGLLEQIQNGKIPNVQIPQIDRLPNIVDSDASSDIDESTLCLDEKLPKDTDSNVSQLDKSFYKTVIRNPKETLKSDTKNHNFNISFIPPSPAPICASHANNHIKDPSIINGNHHDNQIHLKNIQALSFLDFTRDSLTSNTTTSIFDESVFEFPPVSYCTPSKTVTGSSRNAPLNINLNKVKGENQSFICSPIIRKKLNKKCDKSESYILDENTLSIETCNLDLSKIALNKNDGPEMKEFIDLSRSDIMNPSFGQFRCTKLIGEGGYSKVYEAIDTANNFKCAVKVLLESPFVTRQAIEDEIRILTYMSETNYSIKLFHSEIGGGGAFFVMEKANTDMKNFFIQKHDRVDSYFILYFWLQMLRCVKAMHDRRITHLDLKLQNFILTEGFDVKIIDYGISKELPADMSVIYDGENSGTVVYMSPELLQNIRIIHPKKCDIWAMGIILYSIIYNHQPWFKKKDKIIVAGNIEEYASFVLDPGCDFYMPTSANCTQLLLKLMNKCLVESTDFRASVDDLIADIVLDH